MTLNEMKEHFFNEATEIGLASESDILILCDWLEGAGYDADFAYQLWEGAKEEIEYMAQDCLAEFGG